MKFNAYHKIRQFKDIVRDIHHNSNFKGVDAEGEAIYEESPKPVLRFKGTVKLHGTNAGVCYHPADGISAQKRSSLINLSHMDSHMGFNQFVQIENEEYFTKLLSGLHTKYCTEDEQIVIYGEWAGIGIQKGVSISELPKAFYMFDCKIFNLKTEEIRWIDIEDIEIEERSNVYKITDFVTYSIDIDFNNPALATNKLTEITDKVEENCPVAAKLGVNGVGEGVVWTTYWKNQKYIFKVKGTKHSTSKVKTLAKVDTEILNSVNSFVDYTCTANRIDQGIQELGATEKKHIPELLRWVANDIMTEEHHELKANNLEWKNVARECSNRVRQYYFSKLDKI